MREVVDYLIMDIDGTLTDGKINIGITGELFKSFYCRDGLGILNAIKCGIKPVILTSRESEIVIQRARELGIKHILQGVGSSKEITLKRFVDEKQISFDKIAYIGDDVNDLKCIKLCRVTGCPQDAVPEVRAAVTYVCREKGGRGAVREFIDWIIKE